MTARTRYYVTTAAVAALTFLVAAAIAAVLRDDSGPVVVDTREERAMLYRTDAHVLGEPGNEDVTFTEFLDFECESCLAFHPIVEDLRERYAGRVTFVVRYFPLETHENAERAARAVEAAARQDRFEDMYQRMFETQEEWGESREAHDETFRQFADDLGLDLTKYDSDYASAEVAERVRRDVEDGTALGVGGTPTFYVNGNPVTAEDAGGFETAIDDALSD